MNFEEFIKSDRESRNKQKFEGTFLDYLEIVKNNPDVVKLSHKRVYDMLISKGVEVLKGEENPRVKKIYGNDSLKMIFLELIRF